MVLLSNNISGSHLKVFFELDSSFSAYYKGYQSGEKGNIYPSYVTQMACNLYAFSSNRPNLGIIKVHIFTEYMFGPLKNFGEEVTLKVKSMLLGGMVGWRLLAEGRREE